jgi:predicted nucleotidyltransferase component of viral defense system
MELSEVTRIGRELRINPEMATREYWELLVLRRLFESVIGDRLLFKGGTALRLAYGSPRFSDDLDFTQTQSISSEEFRVAVGRIVQDYPQCILTDLAAKRNTLLAEIKVSDPALARPFRIVIEVSRRKLTNSGRELRLLTSPCSPITVLASVAGMESIWGDKLQAICTRNSPRDLFDLWYLSQKLGRVLPESLPRIDRRILRRDLRTYLPAAYYPVVEELARR